MKYKKIFFLIVFFFSIVSTSTMVYASEDTDLNIILEKSTTDDGSPKKEPIYTPKKSEPVRILPQTGEILKSFLFILIGLSILLFCISIVINRTNTKIMNWET